VPRLQVSKVEVVQALLESRPQVLEDEMAQALRVLRLQVSKVEVVQALLESRPQVLEDEMV
jgi:predicted transcriptional regulator